MTPDELRRLQEFQALMNQLGPRQGQQNASQLQNMLSSQGAWTTPYYQPTYATARSYTQPELAPVLHAQEALRRGTITPYLSYVSRGTSATPATPRSSSPSLATRWRARLLLLLGRLPRIKLVKR